jgi:hypothetical protein
MLLAAGLGALGGVVLAFPQWLTLRRIVRGASIWIPANMLAWLVGMPIIFSGIDAAQKLNGLFWLILFIAGVLFICWVGGGCNPRHIPDQTGKNRSLINEKSPTGLVCDIVIVLTDIFNPDLRLSSRSPSRT